MTKPRAKAQPAAPKPTQDPSALLHELQVHQAELESQNEELRQTQVNLATARDRFIDLYDFAPVGYFAIDAEGTILEANLTAATLLGVDRRALVRDRFARHVAPAFGDAWHRHFARALAQHDSQRIELSMCGPGGKPFPAQLDCLRMASGGAEPTLRVALTNVSERHLAEQTRHIAESANRAQEAQRYRVARELHEELGQRLSSLKMDLVDTLTTAQDRTQPAHVNAMLATLDEAVGTVRRITRELAPLMLRDLGLQAAVDWLVHDVAQRSGRQIDATLDVSETPLADSSDVGLYRLAQDMLEPLVQDAGSQAVRFEMRQLPGETLLSLEASGGTWPAQARVDPAHASPVGHRAHLLGARVDVHRAGNDRVRLTVRVPQPLMPDLRRRHQGAAP